MKPLNKDISKSGVVMGLSAVIVTVEKNEPKVFITQGTEESFNVKEFQMGFTSFAYQLRSDGIVILFMIPY